MAVRDERLTAVLQKVAPGTALREGIDRIIRSGKGAIVVLGSGQAVEQVVTGGFKLDAKFTAQRLSEVSKMDGAIIVDDDVDRILRANVHLVPDHTIPTNETGTRHRTSERTAKHTGAPVVCVSEAMRIVNLYVDDIKYTLEDISALLFRANQALATLERYRTRFDEVAAALAAMEVEDVVTLRDVLSVVQRAQQVMRSADEIENAILELGSDGRLVHLQLDELMAGVVRERRLVVKDYLADRRRTAEDVIRALDAVEAEVLLDLPRLAEAMGYGQQVDVDQAVAPRGWRLLSKIPRLPERAVEALVDHFGSLPKLLAADLEALDAVEGIGTARARAVRDGLARLAETSLLERY